MKRLVILISILFSVLELAIYLKYRVQLHAALSNFFQIQASDIEINIIASIIYATIASINIALAILLIRLQSVRHIFFAKRINSVLNKSINWLLSAPTYWGPTINSTESRIANISEGIFCITCIPNKEQEIWKTALSSAVSGILKESEKRGLKSTTLSKFTTHCTSMGFFALAHARKEKLYNFSFEELSKLKSSKIL